MKLSPGPRNTANASRIRGCSQHRTGHAGRTHPWIAGAIDPATRGNGLRLTTPDATLFFTRKRWLKEAPAKAYWVSA
jgi:hypothetical protein